MFSPFTEYLNSLNPAKARERIVSLVEQLEGAEFDGIPKVKEAFMCLFEKSKVDSIAMAELVLVINHLNWLHYRMRNKELCNLYEKLYYKAHYWALDNFKENEIKSYLEIVG